MGADWVGVNVDAHGQLQEPQPIVELPQLGHHLGAQPSGTSLPLPGLDRVEDLHPVESQQQVGYQLRLGVGQQSSQLVGSVGDDLVNAATLDLTVQ
jgi:hypothetical protein